MEKGTIVLVSQENLFKCHTSELGTDFEKVETLSCSTTFGLSLFVFLKSKTPSTMLDAGTQLSIDWF